METVSAAKIETYLPMQFPAARVTKIIINESQFAAGLLSGLFILCEVFVWLLFTPCLDIDGKAASVQRCSLPHAVRDIAELKNRHIAYLHT
jgi:hypothetical protein